METRAQKRRHLLIAGTGRSGTSMLVKLLTACGLETALSRSADGHFWDSDANAGLETIPVLGDDHPYVVKSPWSYQFIDQLLESEHIQLDAVLIPIRNVAEAAASRIIVEMQRVHKQNPAFDALAAPFRDWGGVPGGVTYSLEPIDQARTLALSLHILVERLTEHEIPIHFLKFPRFIRDIDYLYNCLAPILPSSIARADFKAIAGSVIEAGLVRVEDERRAGGEHGDAVRGATGWRPMLPTVVELDNLALKRELQSLRKQAREATEQREALTRERNALAIERDTLANQRDAVASQRDAVANQRDAVTRELHAVSRKLKEVRVDCEGLTERHTALGLRFERLLGSRSWRMTAPLRRLLSRLTGRAREDGSERPAPPPKLHDVR